MQGRQVDELVGSQELVTTYNWVYNPTSNWNTLSIGPIGNYK